jgi:hypothetical protein
MQIQPTITWLDNWAKYFKRLREILSESFSSLTLDGILKEIQEHLRIWLATYEQFRKHLEKVLVNIRRCCCESTVIKDVFSSQQYSLLKETEVQTLNGKIEQLLTIRMLIKRLNHDKIQYINVRDFSIARKIPMTLIDIDAVLQRFPFQENSCISIWYSSDQLKREDADVWEKIYLKLLLEREQSTKKVVLIYADFSQFKQELKEFYVLTLPKQLTSKSLHHHVTGKKSE